MRHVCWASVEQAAWPAFEVCDAGACRMPAPAWQAAVTAITTIVPAVSGAVTPSGGP